MSFRSPDHDSVRVTAVMQSLNHMPVPGPRVDAVNIDGNTAEVRISGSNGLAAVVRLQRSGARWVVRDVAPGAAAGAPSDPPARAA